MTSAKVAEKVVDKVVKVAAVLGAGQMGGGIAHVCALAGLTVHLYDAQAAALPRAQEGIAKNLARQVQKKTITAAAAQQAQAQITTQKALGAWLGEADFIVEAVSEDFAIKQRLYADVVPHLAADAVLASNTSSYSITRLAAPLPDAARFIGMHFMNPVPMMPLVEIIVGAHTSEAVVAATAALAERLGKQTVRARDYPGFITNRILMPMLNEAVFALFESVGGVEDIDRAMTLGMHHPMGPLTLADFIGLDTCLAVLNILHDGFQDPKFRPCPLLRQMVDAGCLGRKSGVGFYDYSSNPPRPAPRFAAQQHG